MLRLLSITSLFMRDNTIITAAHHAAHRRIADNNIEWDTSQKAKKRKLRKSITKLAQPHTKHSKNDPASRTKKHAYFQQMIAQANSMAAKHGWGPHNILKLVSFRASPLPGCTPHHPPQPVNCSQRNDIASDINKRSSDARDAMERKISPVVEDLLLLANKGKTGDIKPKNLREAIAFLDDGPDLQVIYTEPNVIL